MKTLRSLASDIQAAYSSLLAIILISIFIVGIVLGLHLLAGIPVGVLTRDAMAVKGLPLYAGVLSNIGIVLWSAACAICLLTARVSAEHRPSIPTARFLYASGLFTLLLLCDDLFQLHELVFPKLGMPQFLIYGGYVGVALFYLIHFRNMILDSKYPILGLALIFFALSIAMDFLDFPKSKHLLWEDGAKFVGILGWLVYFTDVSCSTLRVSKLEEMPLRS